MASKLVIIGANGFLGRNTLKIASQTWNTIGVVRRKDVFPDIVKYGGIPELVDSFSISSLKPILSNAKTIINFLGIVTGTPEEFQKINVDNFEILVRSAEESGVDKIIMISGLGVSEYGIKPWATNNYFKSKLSMEKILKGSSLSYVIFRPSYILGPGDELIPGLIQALQNGHVDVIGPGTFPMQPIFVKDAVNAFLNAASRVGSDNSTFDLVGPEIITMHNFVQKVKTTLDRFVNIPDLSITNLTIDEAESILGYPREISDIFFCDSIGNPNILKESLQIDLTSLEETINQTIKIELGI